ncbi:GH39 family glycosyl hydrolase [Sphingomonas sp. SAFR-052]|uniref:GH39 family glycosyl hydrolase n=1 Tax=Sphingomonas sp. SAFR-052 TaxID=3436867 RepID=UPI003F7EAE80
MIRFPELAALAAALLPGTAAVAQTRPAAAAAPAAVREVSVTVDARKSLGPLPPAWRFFGADEPNYATMKDGRKLLVELGELKPGEVFFRAHNLLSTGDGTAAFKWGSTNAYTEGPDSKPVYDWTIVDNIIDTYLARGVRPYLQIGFMPEALSTAPKGTPYQHSWRPGFDYRLIATGWTYPPSSYEKWAELVYQWTRHNVERYGADEVNRWYFEVWNEPDSKFYWQASPEDFNKLHDFAIDAVRRALPTAKVGGPDVAVAGDFMDGFMRHVASGKNYVTGQTGTPTDFLSFHAKGAPSFVDGHVRMGLSTHLRNVDRGFTRVAGFPALAAKPIVIGESDPEGCAACPGPQNAYRNGTMYSSYTAASFARIWDLAARRKVNLDGILSWSFEFEDQPWFAGYRQLSTNGVDLPVLNVFRMFAKLGPERIAATSSAQLPLDTIVRDGVRGDADIGALATRTPDGRVAVLLWHYHDDDVAGPVAQVKLDLAGMKAGSATLWRVDGDHANAFTAWQRVGSPQSPNEKQYAELEAASAMQPETVSATGGRSFIIALPRQGVALLTLDRR